MSICDHSTSNRQVQLLFTRVKLNLQQNLEQFLFHVEIMNVVSPSEIFVCLTTRLKMNRSIDQSKPVKSNYPIGVFYTSSKLGSFSETLKRSLFILFFLFALRFCLFILRSKKNALALTKNCNPWIYKVTSHKQSRTFNRELKSIKFKSESLLVPSSRVLFHNLATCSKMLYRWPCVNLHDVKWFQNIVWTFN